jgi:hypothetical protein
MHLGLCFAVTALVWFLMFKPTPQQLAGPAVEPKPGEDAPSSGDAPHE